jgi:hypothetical protein
VEDVLPPPQMASAGRRVTEILPAIARVRRQKVTSKEARRPGAESCPFSPSCVPQAVARRQKHPHLLLFPNSLTDQEREMTTYWVPIMVPVTSSIRFCFSLMVESLK